MRLLSFLPLIGLVACASTGASTSGSTTAGAVSGAPSGSTGAVTGASGSSGSSGSGSTAGSSGTGSGGSVAGSSTGASPIGLWLGGSAAVNANALLIGGHVGLSDSCPPPDDNANPAGVAVFDGQGDLWVQYPSDTSPVYMWTPSQLGQACTSAMPAVTLTSDSFGRPDYGFSAIAFDSQGNLWCASSDSIVGFRAPDLEASGSIEPAWGFEASVPTTGSLLEPIGLAFDPTGNLWIGNSYSVIGYLPATLASAVLVDGGFSQGSAHADFQITNLDDIANLERSQPASFAYRFLAFDSDADLWVTIENTEDGGLNQIVEFSSAQLAALSGNDEPTPAVILTAEVANSVVWGPLAFDSAGNLWAGVEGDQPDLYRFSKTDLASGSHPDLSLIVPGGDAASLAFDPIPTGLPIQP